MMASVNQLRDGEAALGLRFVKVCVYSLVYSLVRSPPSARKASPIFSHTQSSSPNPFHDSLVPT